MSMFIPTSDAEYSEKMKAIHRGDPEIDHDKADKLLCELLVKLDYTKTVEEFKKIEKWYA